MRLKVEFAKSAVKVSTKRERFQYNLNIKFSTKL